MRRRARRAAPDAIEVVELGVINTIRLAIEASGLTIEDVRVRVRKAVSRRHFERLVATPTRLPNLRLLIALQTVLQASQDDLISVVTLTTRDAI